MEFSVDYVTLYRALYYIKESIALHIEKIADFVKNALDSRGGNFVEPNVALSPDLALLKMFDGVVIGVASAKDPYFKELQKEEMIGPHFRKPTDWLPNAESVVSFFFKFCPNIVRSNAVSNDLPSNEWLHANHEGAKFIAKTLHDLKLELEREGFQAIVPSNDSRFMSIGPSKGERRFSNKSFTSFWPEEQIAYACGVGTFGLSGNLISAEGSAGLLGSVVTSAIIPPTEKDYSGETDYCPTCGECVKRCPVRAIDKNNGRDKHECWYYVESLAKKYAPRAVCGKCQSGVLCQSEVPWQ